GGTARVEVLVDGDRVPALGSDECEAAVADDDDRILLHAQLAQGASTHGGAADGRSNLREIANQQRHATLLAARRSPLAYSLFRYIDVIGSSFASCSASSISSCWMVSSVAVSLL